MQVFYANIGGGEPTLRPDFWDLLDYSVAHHVGIKFSTNGVRLDKRAAQRLARTDYVDVQISIDGATADVNDAVRGTGSFALARRAMDNLAAAGFGEFKISIVVTRQNVSQLDKFKQIADAYGARLRVTRLRPSGRGADSWADLHPTAAQQRLLYDWLSARPDVLTGDSFFHLSALGAPLPGLNLCGAGRVVCLIDPVGDVYACPFVLHEEFRAGNVREPGGFTRLWRESELLLRLREPPLRAPARRAGCSPPARAGAWPRSSLPGCRWTGRTRSACWDTASANWRQRKVVVMFDGFGVDYFENSTMPTLRRWQKEGLYRHVKGVMPSVTNANNTSICCGAFPQVHGITGNSYLDTVTGREEYMEDANLVQAPTLFEHAAKRGVSSALLSSKKKTISLLSRGTSLAMSPEEPPSEWVGRSGAAPPIYSREINYWLMRAAIYVLKNRPEIGCLYVHTTDYPMHMWAPSAKESQEHVSTIDDLLGQACAAAPDAAFLLTADHGLNHKRKCYDLDKISPVGAADSNLDLRRAR